MSSTRILAPFAFVAVQVFAQQPQGLPKGGFQPPAPPISVTVSAIPGVVAAGATWTKAWQGDATADGISPTKDGGLLMAQEQTNTVNRIDKNDKASVFLTTPHGPGSIAYDAKGKTLYAVERSCTDPGKPGPCNEATGVAQLTPERKVIANSVGKLGEGKSLGRVNDFTIAKNGHMYITSGPTPVYHLSPSGEVKGFGENMRSNGLVLSRDEKTLFVTNGGTVVAFDLAADGTPSNQREFGKLNGTPANGDGMAIDNEGRLYITCNSNGNWGVQVLDNTGKYIGSIPTPRAPITVAFSGKDKKFLYIGSMGETLADGKEFLTGPNARNTAMTVYKIPVLTPGFKGRLK